MNKKTFFITLIALILVVGVSTVLYNNLKGSVVIDPLQPASQAQSQPEAAPENQPSATEIPAAPAGVVAEITPDFTVYDIDGNPIKLSDHFGKPIVINFWASWCPPCKLEMPYFQAAYEEKGEDVIFLMVNMTDGQRETKEIAISYLEEEGYIFPVYYDTDIDAARTYGIMSLPTSIFVSAEGVSVATAQGAITEEVLAQGIQMAIDG